MSARSQLRLNRKEKILLKKEKLSKLKQITERNLLFDAAKKAYFDHFQFKDVMWIGVKYVEEAINERRPGALECKPSHLLEAEGHPKKDMIITRTGALRVVMAWIGKRYNSVKDVEEGLEEAASHCGLDSKKDEWTFPEVIALTSAYSKVYLDFDKNAGFRANDVDAFVAGFDKHRGGHAALKPDKLWKFLEDFGLVYQEIEQQKYVLRVLNEVDDNQNGALDPEELLHLFRKLIDHEKAEPREREFKLLKDSGMPLDECENWFDVYTKAVEDRQGQVEGKLTKADNYISVADVKSVFEPLGMKPNREDTDKLRSWLTEVDTDFNGQIDFGEFCCLVQRMWSVNFCGIQKIAPSNDESS
jgi:Ca2+-binding EF-hand superfamily protein